MSEEKEIQHIEQWSYSKLNSFPLNDKESGCKYGWHRTYRLKQRGIGNCFAEYGLIYHTIMKELLDGEIFSFDEFKQKDVRETQALTRSASVYFDPKMQLPPPVLIKVK